MALTRRRGRVVYMPTVDAEYTVESAGQFGLAQRLLPEVRSPQVMAKHDLGIHGHQSEVLMLIRAAKAAGVNKIYVQHPNHGGS